MQYRVDQNLTPYDWNVYFWHFSKCIFLKNFLQESVATEKTKCDEAFDEAYEDLTAGRVIISSFPKDFYNLFMFVLTLS